MYYWRVLLRSSHSVNPQIVSTEHGVLLHCRVYEYNYHWEHPFNHDDKLYYIMECASYELDGVKEAAVEIAKVLNVEVRGVARISMLKELEDEKASRGNCSIY